MRALCCFVLAFITSAAVAKTYVTADYFIDVETGKRVNDAIIVIDAGRVVSTDGNLDERQSDDELIELPGLTLLPGLIDMHVHITSNPDLQGYNRLKPSEQRSLLAGVKNAREMLHAGITTIRNLGTHFYGDIALRDAINDGDIIGPRIFASGASLGITGGHCDSNLLPMEYGYRRPGVADGPWEVTTRVRENIKYGSDVIKFCATGGVMSKGTNVGVQQYTFEEMQAIVREAHQRGRTVAAHAHGTEGIKTAIRAGVDSIEHASFIDDEGIALAKEKGTYLSMDIYVTEYILGRGAALGILEESLAKERVVGRTQRENFSKAVDAGINMVMGTDAGIFPHAESPRQLSRMVQFGMTPVQALQAATINGATLLGKETEFGSISPGKFADIIAVSGNPLDDISVVEDVRFVMKEGRVVKHSTE